MKTEKIKMYKVVGLTQSSTSKKYEEFLFIYRIYDFFNDGFNIPDKSIAVLLLKSLHSLYAKK